ARSTTSTSISRPARTRPRRRHPRALRRRPRASSIRPSRTSARPRADRASESLPHGLQRRPVGLERHVEERRDAVRAAALVTGEAVEDAPPVPALAALAVGEEREDVELPLRAVLPDALAVIDVQDERARGVPLAEAPEERERDGVAVARSLERLEIPPERREDRVPVARNALEVPDRVDVDGVAVVPA